MSDVSPVPTPVPTPVPVSPLKSVSSWFGKNLLNLILVPSVGYLIYQDFHKPALPDSPLVAAAKSYVKTLPDAYATTSAQVKNGVLTDKTAVVEALKAHAKPLATALDTTFTPLIDPSNGKITNVTEAANALEQVSRGLGGK